MQARHLFFIVIIVLVAGYFMFEARGVLFAPSLRVLEPENGSSYNTTRIHIAGVASADEKVFVNGREFVPKQNGEFDGTLTLDPGYNEIGFLVRDRFNNETKKVVKVTVQ